MSIRFTSGGPTDTLDRLQALKWGDDLARLSGAGGGGEETAMTIGTPYQVDYLALDDVANGNLQKRVAVTQWRHLIVQGEQPLAEVEMDRDGNPVALYEGPGKDGLQQALARADALEGDYEARVVQSAALKFIALLLTGGTQDLFIPYPPNLTPLANFEPVTVPEAMAVLQPLATDIREAMRGDDSIGG